MSAPVSRGMLWALAATLVLTAASFAVRKWRESSPVAPPVEVAAAEPAKAGSESPPPAAVPPPPPATVEPPPVVQPPAPPAAAVASALTTAPTQPATPPPPAAPPPPEPITFINPLNGLPQTLPPGVPPPPDVKIVPTPKSATAVPASPAPTAAPPSPPAAPKTPPAVAAPPPLSALLDASKPVTPGLRPPTLSASTDAMAGRRPPPPPAAPAPASDVPPPPPPLPPPSFRLIGRYADSAGPVAFFVEGDKVIAVRVGGKLPQDFVLKSIRADGVTVLRKANKESIDMPLGTL